MRISTTNTEATRKTAVVAAAADSLNYKQDATTMKRNAKEWQGIPEADRIPVQVLLKLEEIHRMQHPNEKTPRKSIPQAHAEVIKMRDARKAEAEALLQQHRDEQRRQRQEQVFGSVHRATNSLYRPALALDEILRHFPATPAISRSTVEDLSFQCASECARISSSGARTCGKLAASLKGEEAKAAKAAAAHFKEATRYFDAIAGMELSEAGQGGRAADREQIALVYRATLQAATNETDKAFALVGNSSGVLEIGSERVKGRD